MATLFSIITVTYNAASTLPATLRSIEEQTCRLYEFILMDGVSSDNTVELAQKADVNDARIFSSYDTGLYDAMNKAISVARGEYLIFLNAGDTFHTADTLDIIAKAALDNDFPGIIYGQTQIVDSNRQRIADRHLIAPDNLSFDSFKDGMVVCHQAFIVLRRVAGVYDLSYRFSADYEWCIRCLQKSKRNQMIDEILIDYLNEGMTTRNRFASLRERFSIMSRYYGFFPTLLRHFRFLPRYFKYKNRVNHELKNHEPKKS